jgi:dienelactone hydrolase
MTTPEADLTGWTVAPISAAGYTHDVYRKGEGPGVVLIPEMPGIHPGVLALGNHLVDNGFTVACPSLYGTPGAAARDGADHAARLCGKGIRGVRDQR